MFIDFKKDRQLGSVLRQWWQVLDVHPIGQRLSDSDAQADGGERALLHLRGDRAGRAALRRAGSVTAVVMTPAYQRLYGRLCAAGWQPDRRLDGRDDRLAAAVGLLAHVEVDDDRPLPQAMSRRGKEGPPAGDDRPPVSPLRFMRLLESPDLDALFTGLRRTLPLLRGGDGVRADVLALATDVVNWHGDDRVRKRWAYGYEWPDKPGD